MPEFTAIFWNIQDMGNNGQYRDYPGLMRFIAVAAHAKGADVVALMELRRIGVHHLGLLRAALNAVYGAAGLHHDWQFDWIPAAINSRVPNHVMPTAYAELGWETKANGEGYVVFWNHDPAKLEAQPAGHAMSGGVNRNLARGGYQGGAPPAGVPANILELVIEGRRRGEPPNHFDDSDLPNARPMDLDNDIADEDFERLDFLTNISNKPTRTVTRRPCYCTFRLLDGEDEDRGMLSFLVFHAPGVIKFKQVAAVGTRLYSFSRALYQAPDDLRPRRVVAGGDLNLNTDDGPAYLMPAIEGFLNRWDDDDVPGADCEQLAPNNATSNSTVRLATGALGMMGAPIVGDAPADFRAYAIDNAFFRDFDEPDDDMGGGNAPIYDLIAAVTEVDNPFQDAIRSFATLFYDDPPGHVDPDNFEEILSPDRDPPPAVQEDGDFLAGIIQGWFPTARSGAEFVRLLISDHLPVVFRGLY